MKVDCYECKYRGRDRTVRSVRIMCKHPNRMDRRKLNIKGNARGIHMGRFNWPYDFDPVWLENCDGKETEG